MRCYASEDKYLAKERERASAYKQRFAFVKPGMRAWMYDDYQRVWPYRITAIEGINACIEPDGWTKRDRHWAIPIYERMVLNHLIYDREEA